MTIKGEYKTSSNFATEKITHVVVHDLQILPTGFDSHSCKSMKVDPRDSDPRVSLPAFCKLDTRVQ